MTRVLAEHSMSLDGYSTGSNVGIGNPLFKCGSSESKELKAIRVIDGSGVTYFTFRLR